MSKTEEDYYKLLGITKDASEIDILKAWKKLSKKCHPDKNVDNPDWAHEMQKKLNEAKNTLIDPQKRKIYDLYGKDGKDSFKNGKVNGNRFRNENMNIGMGGMGDFQNFNKIFGNFFDGSNFFRNSNSSDEDNNSFFGNTSSFENGNLFGGNNHPFGDNNPFDHPFFKNSSNTNTTINNNIKNNTNFIKNKLSIPKETSEISLTLEDVYKGYSSTKNVKISKRCSSCEGIGKKYITNCKGCEGKGIKVCITNPRPGMITQTQGTCNDCNGKKRVGFGDDNCEECKGIKMIDKNYEIEVVFSPGVKDGDIFQKEEDEIEFIFIGKVDEHPIYKREGNNLRFLKEINLYEALTGVEFTLKLLDNREILVKSKEIIKPGTEYRLEKLGINGGDILINFDIIFPDKIHGKKSLSKVLGMEGSDIQIDKKVQTYFVK